MNVKVLSHADVRKFFPLRDRESHKGQNGKVLVIGGSIDYYGAPLLSALGAFRSGVDLVFMLVPECNFEVTRNFSANLIVRSYRGEAFNQTCLKEAWAWANEADVLLIGPGLGKRKKTCTAVIDFLSELNKPLVLDGQALLPWETYRKFPSGQVILTPHMAELERVMGANLKRNALEECLTDFAQAQKVNILLKGAVDKIAAQDGRIVSNKSGNAGMTVGGSGDVLAGAVAGLMAQKSDPFETMCIAAYCVGKAGENLYKSRKYGYMTDEIAHETAHVISTL